MNKESIYNIAERNLRNMVTETSQKGDYFHEATHESFIANSQRVFMLEFDCTYNQLCSGVLPNSNNEENTTDINNKIINVPSKYSSDNYCIRKSTIKRVIYFLNELKNKHDQNVRIVDYDYSSKKVLKLECEKNDYYSLSIDIGEKDVPLIDSKDIGDKGWLLPINYLFEVFKLAEELQDDLIMQTSDVNTNKGIMIRRFITDDKSYNYKSYIPIAE